MLVLLLLLLLLRRLSLADLLRLLLGLLLLLLLIVRWEILGLLDGSALILSHPRLSRGLVDRLIASWLLSTNPRLLRGGLIVVETWELVIILHIQLRLLLLLRPRLLH